MIVNKVGVLVVVVVELELELELSLELELELLPVATLTFDPGVALVVELEAAGVDLPAVVLNFPCKLLLSQAANNIADEIKTAINAFLF